MEIEKFDDDFFCSLKTLVHDIYEKVIRLLCNKCRTKWKCFRLICWAITNTTYSSINVNANMGCACVFFFFALVYLVVFIYFAFFYFTDYLLFYCSWWRRPLKDNLMQFIVMFFFLLFVLVWLHDYLLLSLYHISRFFFLMSKWHPNKQAPKKCSVLSKSSWSECVL